jgi:mRNA interferase MazF
MAMIMRATNTVWPGDHALADLGQAGLPAASYVRLKLFTLENRLILRQSGTLATADVAGFRAATRLVLE